MGGPKRTQTLLLSRLNMVHLKMEISLFFSPEITKLTFQFHNQVIIQAVSGKKKTPFEKANYSLQKKTVSVSKE